MKIIGVIPARFASTRFPGKPLAEILGKPMIWWVYQQAKKVSDFSDVIVATDDERIMGICRQNAIPVTMTNPECDTPTTRVWEVSNIVKGDVYVFIGGDEPLITPEAISKVIKQTFKDKDFFVANAMTTIKSPPEVIDFTNIKMVCNTNGDGLYCSRSPLPYPKGSLGFEYKKFVGICAITKAALDFYVNTPKSKLEIIEECDLIRFIEHHKKVKFIDIECDTLSIDTPKDLERVCEIMQCAMDRGELDVAKM
jgi:3-deoxy-manno-octulosonate cytidylyltransferase (CMP-KDO synthetase)